MHILRKETGNFIMFGQPKITKAIVRRKRERQKNLTGITSLNQMRTEFQAPTTWTIETILVIICQMEQIPIIPAAR